MFRSAAMRAACCTPLPAAMASAPGCSGRGGRSDGVAVVRRAMRAPPPPSSAAAVVGLDLLLRHRPSPPLAPAAAAALARSSSSFSSSRFRPRVPARRSRQFSHPRATPEDAGDDEGAPSTSSSSSNEKPVDVEVENGEKAKSPPKKATPLGDLIALISPARKREAGGPPPPTLSKRLRAIRGSLWAVAGDAWQKTL